MIVLALNNDGDFIPVLRDVISKRGSMYKIVIYRSLVDISNNIKDVLRHLCIRDWQSEPHFQHQNFDERRFQYVKRNINQPLIMTGSPSNTWLLYMGYVFFIMNIMSLYMEDTI